jgi:hypothetical protein
MSDPKPIDPNTPLDDLHPARFLKVSDLLDRWHVQSIIVEIAILQWESTIPNPKDLDPATADQKNPKGKPREVTQPVLYFKTKNGDIFQRGYLISSKADTEALKAATKAAKVGEMIGKRIKITVGEHRHAAVLRIDPNPPG